ncbi:DegV domain-containing protein [Pelotomaculum sp. FP]|uniref:DegV family protein n=1 Tax=Pelotomaculum sp. FP TaxID=261474 RepID=UPI001064BDC9|nr:DegV family protein [Pelotomaculum sp. FP]TEB16617.1 DegV domain-containing protein [Pelotomaculum sp. FP]
MNKIAIVTDSTADLPNELVSQYGITVVPLKVIFNGSDTFFDGVDMQTEEFYRRLTEKGQTATTSQPSPAEFADCYGCLLPQYSIISIHISSVMSGTAQSARVARDMFPGSDIEVVDSKSCSMGLGLLVLEAARAAMMGKSKADIMDIIHKTIPKIRLFFSVDSLKYLKEGGRIGKAQALLGAILSIKPILYLNEGVVEPYEKVRGKARAIERLAQIIAEKAGGKRIKCCVLHGDAQEGAELVLKLLTPIVNCDKPIISKVGPVVGTHVGPGVVGAVFIPE